jgi:hypothetical protein
VKREGNERASSTHPTQKEAIEAARELAHELDDIVIHRTDGTIRERVTYYGESGQPTNGDQRTERTERTERVAGPQDLVSVGRRVSWGAVLAGAVIAFASYVAMTLLALAIGLSAADRVEGRTFTVTSAIVSAIILLISLFLGGFVASRATAGETRAEGASYGVLVWGTMFLALALGGLGFGFGILGSMRPILANPNNTVSAERMRSEVGLTDDQVQRYEAMVRDPQRLAAETSAPEAAWWAFAGVAASLLAAIGGGLVGAGPELTLRRADNGRAVVAAPRPA